MTLCVQYIILYYIILRSTSVSLSASPCYGKSPYWDSGFQRVWFEHNLNSKGWNSHVHREFPGKFESSSLSRDNVSREIGRTSENRGCLTWNTPCYDEAELSRRNRHVASDRVDNRRNRNRAWVTSVATIYHTTRPPMLLYDVTNMFTLLRGPLRSFAAALLCSALFSSDLLYPILLYAVVFYSTVPHSILIDSIILRFVMHCYLYLYAYVLYMYIYIYIYV